MADPGWASLSYTNWPETCDTLHAHTQLLGKLAVALAPPEPQLQHAALRLTARGWETLPLPAPDGSGAFVAALDLHRHEAVVEHSGGAARRIALTPDRSVGAVTRDVLAAAAELAGPVAIDPTPQEVPWTVPLDEDEEHATYDAGRVETYFAVAVNLFSGAGADPPSGDFIMRNAMDAQEVAVGWWPGDPRYPTAALYAYAHPAPEGFADGTLAPDAARWEPDLGEFVLRWEDLVAASDPHADGLEFARSAFRHACLVCGWDPALPASAEGRPPPVV
jgi:hypothetical protein